MNEAFDITEPEVKREHILLLDDSAFINENVCIVTGAGSGIGRAVAIASAVNNLLTIGVDYNEKAVEKTAEIAAGLGGKMDFIRADLTVDKDIETAVEKAASLGKIRYLANVAGIQTISPIEDFPMEKYDQMQNLMLRAPFYLSRLVIPHIKNNGDGCGVIANMASIHAHICPPNKSVYCITKFGLRGLTQAISAEGQGRIRSFSLSTAYIKTPLVLNQIADQAKTRNVTAKQVVEDIMLGNSRIKDMMTPAEVANLLMFGFSHHGRFLIGSDMLFDGGVVRTY